MTEDEIFWSKDAHTIEFIASESGKQGLFSLWLSSFNYNGKNPYLKCYLAVSLGSFNGRLIYSRNNIYS